MKKFILFLILFLVIAITFGLIYFLLPEVLLKEQPSDTQAGEQLSPEEAQLQKLSQNGDKVADINEGLNTIDLGDLNKEFTDIDKDINSL